MGFRRDHPATGSPGRTGCACTRRYLAETLRRADLASIVPASPSSGTTALLCVERDPEACHRSLIAERLAARHAVSIEHLRPAG
jgi:hypothetical protein